MTWQTSLKTKTVEATKPKDYIKLCLEPYGPEITSKTHKHSFTWRIVWCVSQIICFPFLVTVFHKRSDVFLEGAQQLSVAEEKPLCNVLLLCLPLSLHPLYSNSARWQIRAFFARTERERELWNERFSSELGGLWNESLAPDRHPAVDLTSWRPSHFCPNTVY